MRYFTTLLLLVSFRQVLHSQPYYAEDVSGLPPITAVLEQGGGELWLGTEAGLYVRRPGQSQFTLESLSGTTPPHISRIIKYYGKIWVGTYGQGAFYQDGISWLQLNRSNGLPSNTINDMCKAAGELWMATDTGLARYNGNTIFTYQPFSGSPQITAIASDGTAVWASNRSFSEPLMKYYFGSWTPLPSPPNSQANALGSFAVDSAGTIVGTSRFGVGIFSFAGGQWHVLSNSQNVLIGEFSGDSIYVIADNALHLVRGNSLKHLHATSIPDHYAFKSFSSAGANSFWLGGKQNAVGELLKLSRIKHTFYAELNINALRAGFSPSSIFRNEYSQTIHDDGYGKFYQPGSPDITMIFAGGIWTAGTVNGQSKGAAHTYDISGRDWYAGPVSSSYDEAYIKRYNRVWKISRQQIEHHRLYQGRKGYTMPEVIRHWPGHGRSSAGESSLLAPFVDFNGNFRYEPEIGEYPQIKGDQAIFMIFNDSRGPHHSSGSQPLGLEIHAMAYAFDTLDADLDHTIFLSLKIHNRSNANIDNFITGLWTDFDLGYPMDDLLGCDSAQGLTYVYNGNNNDPGPLGFQANPPALGIQFLSDSIDASIHYANSNATLPSAVTDPVFWSHYVNYLKGLWKDGSPLLLESPSGLMNSGNGDGYVPSGTGYPQSKFHYNDQANWYHNPQSPMDLRSLSSVSMGTLPSGDSKCLEVAYTYARDTVQGHLSSLSLLKSRGAALQQYYSNTAESCLESYIGQEEIMVVKNIIEIFPNPTGSLLNIRLIDESERLQSSEIYDLSGQRVRRYGAESVINVEDLAPGIYLLQCETGVGRVSFKFIRE